MDKTLYDVSLELLYPLANCCESFHTSVNVLAEDVPTMKKKAIAHGMTIRKGRAIALGNEGCPTEVRVACYKIIPYIS